MTLLEAAGTFSGIFQSWFLSVHCAVHCPQLHLSVGWLSVRQPSGTYSPCVFDLQQCPNKCSANLIIQASSISHFANHQVCSCHHEAPQPVLMQMVFCDQKGTRNFIPMVSTITEPVKIPLLTKCKFYKTECMYNVNKHVIVSRSHHDQVVSLLEAHLWLCI